MRSFALFLIFLSSYLPAQEHEIDSTRLVYLNITDLDFDIDNLDISSTSGFLSARNDIFQEITAFQFGTAFFNVRGLESQYASMSINHIPVNNLVDGRVDWNLWGGLNEVTRQQYTELGLGSTYQSFGGIIGSANTEMAASDQRKQKKFAYAFTNRAYSHRLMYTYSTGWLENDWSFSVSGSRRWAQEGYIPGTFYYAWAYYAAADKRLGNHIVGLSVFGAPIRKGKQMPAVQEAYDLAGTNFYNPNWGWQEGKKRNNREARTHQPITMLTHNYENNGWKWNNTASYLSGKDSDTQIEWFDAPDPRPDYYSKLPFNQTDPTIREQMTTFFQDNPDELQMDWDQIYQINYGNYQEFENANGIEGNTHAGLRSQYIILERHRDNEWLSFSSNVEKYMSEELSLQGGFDIQQQKINYYNSVDDLLGGEYYVNLDRFADRDFAGDDDKRQNDIENPNRILFEGDQFDHDYDLVSNMINFWSVGDFAFDNLSGFVGGQVGRKSFYRDSRVMNGLFPENSKGKSETISFDEYAVKGGLAYNINVKHRFFANASYREQAPIGERLFVSADTRNEIIPDAEREKISAVEGGYEHNGPNLKFKAIGYLIQLNDGIDLIRFYHDLERSFGSLNVRNVDREHRGLELGSKVKIRPGFWIHAVAALGQHYYTDRPVYDFQIDNTGVIEESNRNVTSYIDGYRVPGIQDAYSIGFDWQLKNRWRLNFFANYFDEIWIEPNLISRTVNATQNIEYQSQHWYDFLRQTQADGQLILNLTVNKGIDLDRLFGWEKDYYLNIHAQISNLLDNQDFITSGFEQYRIDDGVDDAVLVGDSFNYDSYNNFPPKFFHFSGFNYFVNLSFRY